MGHRPNPGGPQSWVHQSQMWPVSEGYLEEVAWEHTQVWEGVEEKEGFGIKHACQGLGWGRAPMLGVSGVCVMGVARHS